MTRIHLDIADTIDSHGRVCAEIVFLSVSRELDPARREVLLQHGLARVRRGTLEELQKAELEINTELVGSMVETAFTRRIAELSRATPASQEGGHG